MNRRRLWVLMRREARATLRDPFTVSILILVPLVALVLFGSILSTEVHGLALGVLDGSQSRASRKVIDDIAASGSFVPRPFATRAELDRALVAGEISVAMVIPPDFERDRGSRGAEPASLQIIYDGGETVLAGNAEAFLTGLVAASSLEASGTPATIAPLLPAQAQGEMPADARVRVVPRALFNPSLAGQPFMVAGTFGFVLSFATTLIIAVAIVNERSAGTFEQLQVTPATSLEILLGKILPLGAVFSADVVLMMLAAGFLFGVWPSGSAIFFVLLSTFYQVVSLSLGVIISATSATAAEAVAKTVLLATPLIQLSGFAFPTRNMSWPFQWIAELIPATHYIRVSRAIYLRGEGPFDVLGELLVILFLGVTLVFFALRAIGRRG